MQIYLIQKINDKDEKEINKQVVYRESKKSSWRFL